MSSQSTLKGKGRKNSQAFQQIIDLFTDTVTILNYLDLRSFMGCPRGMSTIQYTRIGNYARFLGQLFFIDKFS